MIFDPEKILVKSLEDSCGLTSYSKTLQFKGINVATDTEYQKNYTNYYRVRRDSNWLKEYYTFFEKIRIALQLHLRRFFATFLISPTRSKSVQITPMGWLQQLRHLFQAKCLQQLILIRQFRIVK